MLQIFDADEEFLVGSRGHILVTVWGRVTYDRLKRAIAVNRWVLEDTDFRDRGFGGVAVLVPRRAVTTDAMEAQSKTLEDLVAPYLIANATVIEGEGVRSSLARNAAKASSATRLRRHPERFFDDVTEAVRWLLPLVKVRTGDAFSSEDLAWDIAEARAHYLGS